MPFEVFLLVFPFWNICPKGPPEAFRAFYFIGRAKKWICGLLK
jgi:hypothetical protein